MTSFTKTMATKNRSALWIVASLAILVIASVAASASSDPIDIATESASVEQAIEPAQSEAPAAVPGHDAGQDVEPAAASCEAESAVTSALQLTTSVVEASGSCYSQGWECGVSQDPNCGGACRCQIVANGCGYCPC